MRGSCMWDQSCRSWVAGRVTEPYQHALAECRAAIDANKCNAMTTKPADYCVSTDEGRVGARAGRNGPGNERVCTEAPVAVLCIAAKQHDKESHARSGVV